MTTDGWDKDRIVLKEIPELLEMEMEEFDSGTDKYSEMHKKIDQLVKNLMLMKINNKRNELNILYLFQRMNNKKVSSSAYEEIFRDLDNIFDDVNNNNYKYDELIAKNNEMGKKLNPMVQKLLK